MIKLKYIKCMEDMYEDVLLPEYENTDQLRKDIEENKVIKVIYKDSPSTDYINPNYIMFFGE